MTNVLLIVPGPSYGGAHNQAATLATPLAEHGFTSSVVLPDEPGDALERLRRAGVRVSTMRLRRLRAGQPSNNLLLLATFPWQVVRLRSLIRSRGADVVQVHGIQQLDAAIAARLAGAAVVWQLLDTRAPRLLMTVLRPALRWLSDAVLVTGRATAEAHGISVAPPSVVSYYPPVPEVPTALAPAAVRDLLDVPQDALLVGTLANFNPQKGHEVLLDAFPLLDVGDRPVRLRVRGGAAAGHEQYLERLVAAGLVIEPTGRVVSNLEPALAPRDFLAALDVLVLASVSRSEGLPTVIIEAMKAGACVVASRVGGVPEMIEDGSTGVLVEAGSPRALADALQALVDDPHRVGALAAAGQAHARAHYSLDESVNSYLTAYRAAAQRRSERAGRRLRSRSRDGGRR